MRECTKTNVNISRIWLINEVTILSKRKKRRSILFIPAFIIMLLGIFLMPIAGRCTERITGKVTQTEDGLKICYVINNKVMEGTPSISINQFTKKTDYELYDSVDVLYNDRNHKNFIIADEGFNYLTYAFIITGMILFIGDSVAGDRLPESFVFRLLNKEITKPNS